MIFQVENQAGLAVVTINRAPVNAINAEFLTELIQLVETLGADQSVRAVLFRSGIPGKFIAGADLAGVLQSNDDTPMADRIRALTKLWRQAFNALDLLPQPTLAAIDGHCFGGGLEFALCCDYRLMVDDGQAKIGLTETNLGIFPAAGGPVRLPRIVGLAKAKDMIYRGLRLTGPEAKAIGLVHETYAPEEFSGGVIALAQELAGRPTLALRAAKATIMAGLTDAQEAHRLEDDGFIQVIQTEDAAEGLTAFWEKRAPQFKGR